MVQITSNSFSVAIKSAPPSANVPAWVPSAGYFADVPMLNNPQDVTPALYASDAFGADSPFVMWGGSAILRDYSPLSAQVYYSGGHEASLADPNLQFSLICDFSTLQWSAANIPLAANPGNTYDSNGMFADGTPYTPHTYLGLQEIPAAWGGAKRGSIASFFWAGSRFPNRINVLDVSAASRGYSLMATRQGENADPTLIRFARTGGDVGSYPITVQDDARQGWWASHNGSADYILFISKSGNIQQFPALGGNLANGALVLCPSLNLLVAIDGGYAEGPNAGAGYRSLYIRDLNSGITTRNTTLGNVPSVANGYDGSVGTFRRPDTMGLQWVDQLGCVVGLDQSVSPPVIVKLTPPANGASTSPWTWSVVAVQHWPQDRAGQTTLQVAQNGVWSKFRWVPSLQAFVYGSKKNRRPQVIKLA